MQEVRVAAGVTRLAATGTIVGSRLTMDAALRCAVHSGLSTLEDDLAVTSVVRGGVSVTEQAGRSGYE